MNIYIETNFILELALLQEQNESCEQIVNLHNSRNVRLVLPAFCIAESYETLIRRASKRNRLASELAGELGQLSRSKPYKDQVNAYQNITAFLVRSSQDEDQRLIDVLETILRIADIVALGASIVSDATQYRIKYELEPQDSFVYASVMHHLSGAGNIESCFLNRNRRDFDDPDIEENLSNRGCKMLFSFADGYNYILHRTNTSMGN